MYGSSRTKVGFYEKCCHQTHIEPGKRGHGYGLYDEDNEINKERIVQLNLN